VLSNCRKDKKDRKKAVLFQLGENTNRKRRTEIRKKTIVKTENYIAKISIELWKEKLADS
jgi:hypothetical protein